MHLAGQGQHPAKSRATARIAERGYAMAALLVAISVIAIVMTAVLPVWKQAAQREKESELVFRGEQYARAIGLFQRKFANAYPPNIDTLVEQRFLRKKYKDPITNGDFVPLLQGQSGATPGSGAQTADRPGQTPTTGGAAIRAQLDSTTAAMARTQVGAPTNGPTGGIIGVTSKSPDKSIRIYKGRTHYNEWAFVYVPTVQAPGGPGGAGTPGAAGPGRGGRGQPPSGTSLFPGTGGPGRGGRGDGRGNPAGGRGPFSPGFPGGTSPFSPVPPNPGSGRGR